MKCINGKLFSKFRSFENLLFDFAELNTLDNRGKVHRKTYLHE